jgi:hypothetical protein
MAKTTFNQTPEYIEGTVADIIGRGKESRLRINGKVVKQPDLSVLARLGLATEVGVAERPEGKRGPAPVIYRLMLNQPNMVVARR